MSEERNQADPRCRRATSRVSAGSYHSRQQAMRLQFRGELFNAFNQVNFALPVTNAARPTFGRLPPRATGRPGRVGHIAIKRLW